MSEFTVTIIKSRVRLEMDMGAAVTLSEALGRTAAEYRRAADTTQVDSLRAEYTDHRDSLRDIKRAIDSATRVIS